MAGTSARSVRLLMINTPPTQSQDRHLVRSTSDNARNGEIGRGSVALTSESSGKNGVSQSPLGPVDMGCATKSLFAYPDTMTILDSRSDDDLGPRSERPSNPIGSSTFATDVCLTASPAPLSTSTADTSPHPPDTTDPRSPLRRTDTSRRSRRRHKPNHMPIGLRYWELPGGSVSMKKHLGPVV
jgi:hypothetical protein